MKANDTATISNPNTPSLPPSGKELNPAEKQSALRNLREYFQTKQGKHLVPGPATSARGDGIFFEEIRTRAREGLGKAAIQEASALIEADGSPMGNEILSECQDLLTPKELDILLPFSGKKVRVLELIVRELEETEKKEYFNRLRGGPYSYLFKIVMRIDGEALQLNLPCESMPGWLEPAYPGEEVLAAKIALFGLLRERQSRAQSCPWRSRYSSVIDVRFNNHRKPSLEDKGAAEKTLYLGMDTARLIDKLKNMSSLYPPTRGPGLSILLRDVLDILEGNPLIWPRIWEDQGVHASAREACKAFDNAAEIAWRQWEILELDKKSFGEYKSVHRQVCPFSRRWILIGDLIAGLEDMLVREKRTVRMQDVLDIFGAEMLVPPCWVDEAACPAKAVEEKIRIRQYVDGLYTATREACKAYDDGVEAYRIDWGYNYLICQGICAFSGWTREYEAPGCACPRVEESPLEDEDSLFLEE